MLTFSWILSLVGLALLLIHFVIVTRRKNISSFTIYGTGTMINALLTLGALLRGAVLVAGLMGGMMVLYFVFTVLRRPKFLDGAVRELVFHARKRIRL